MSACNYKHAKIHDLQIFLKFVTCKAKYRSCRLFIIFAEYSFFELNQTYIPQYVVVCRKHGPAKPKQGKEIMAVFSRSGVFASALTLAALVAQTAVAAQPAVVTKAPAKIAATAGHTVVHTTSTDVIHHFP